MLQLILLMILTSTSIFVGLFLFIFHFNFIILRIDDNTDSKVSGRLALVCAEVSISVISL